MKKVFVEPEIHRIELNLHENIATSVTNSADVYFNSQAWFCPVISIATIEELIAANPSGWRQTAAACISYNSDKTTSGLRNNRVPLEEVYRRYGHLW